MKFEDGIQHFIDVAIQTATAQVMAQLLPKMGIAFGSPEGVERVAQSYETHARLIRLGAEDVGIGSMQTH